MLLIDDDMVSREVAATVLTMNGYMVHTAENGNSSLKMLGDGAFRPDVILMDAQMPGLSGVQLIAELRKRTKARIFVISGSNAAPSVADEADGFLVKPFNAEGLGKLLEGHKPEAGPSLLDPDEPVVSAEVLAQLRRVMPEPAVRQIYAAVVADLDAPHRGAGSRDCQRRRRRSSPHRPRHQGWLRHGRGPSGRPPGCLA